MGDNETLSMNTKKKLQNEFQLTSANIFYVYLVSTSTLKNYHTRFLIATHLVVNIKYCY